MEVARPEECRVRGGRVRVHVWTRREFPAQQSYHVCFKVASGVDLHVSFRSSINMYSTVQYEYTQLF